MEPMMKIKREVATLLPYRKRGEELEFFLQKRGPDMKFNPGRFGLFGGGLEGGETVEQALFREIEEELEYVPKKPVYFSRYEHASQVNHVFFEEVGEGFETVVRVHEGEYGKFLTLDEMKKRDDVSINAILFVVQVREEILK